MAIKTYTQELEEVQAAIGAVLSGAQSYAANGRSLTRADLKTLYEREKFLRTMSARETENGGRAKIQYVVPE